MIVIQIILIIGVLCAFGYFLTHVHSYSTHAWRKILLLAFAAVMVMSILMPSLMTDIANLVGVGRGADLLLYLLAIAFVFNIMNSYLKFQQQRTQIHKLARRMAILEAEEKQRNG